MVKVLFDHNMPPCIARSIHELIRVDGHKAFSLRDRFPTTTISDIDYFNGLGSDWIVISKDLQNSKKKAEKTAINRNNIVAFYLSPSLQKKKVNEQAAAIMWHCDKMVLQRSIIKGGLFQFSEVKSKFRAL